MYSEDRHPEFAMSISREFQEGASELWADDYDGVQDFSQSVEGFIRLAYFPDSRPMMMIRNVGRCSLMPRETSSFLYVINGSLDVVGKMLVSTFSSGDDSFQWTSSEDSEESEDSRL